MPSKQKEKIGSILVTLSLRDRLYFWSLVTLELDLWLTAEITNLCKTTRWPELKNKVMIHSDLIEVEQNSKILRISRVDPTLLTGRNAEANPMT
jgi:hypothetical protein